MITNPDLDWYTEISEKKGKPPRCPFATVHRCPRLFQSVSLLGEVGIITNLDPKLDRILFRKWKKSEFWPTIAEQETSITPVDQQSKGFRHFCPEVAHDTFGYFAAFIYDYSDETDRDNAHRQLSWHGAQRSDWRWMYASVKPLHYTQCQLYSLLEGHRQVHQEVLELEPNFHGIGINLKALWRRALDHSRWRP